MPAAKPPSGADDQDSPHSKTARLACWLTGGGTRRSPTTAVSFLKMAQERKAVEKAEAEWKKRKKTTLDLHVDLWGNIGRMGTIEEMAAIGPRLRGTALLRWYREHGGEGGSASAIASREGRTIEEREMTADAAGGQAAEDRLAGAADTELGAVAGGQPHENQENTAPAGNDDDDDVPSSQGGGENTSGTTSGENAS